ncbi:MAG: glutaredoxin [Halioglobus sp.]
MFALEWCEFCWSVRKMLAEYGIPYRSIDLDSVEYQVGDRGGKLRAALRDTTTWNTFPQIFIKGEFVGGCTDLFDACKEGSLQQRLASHEIPCDPEVSTDPYSHLPGWLHPR